jgi:two-component system, chemotaxis family, chemotaxis protein CheY
VRPSKILLVEDSPVVRLTVKKALESSGARVAPVLEAGTAHEAVERFEAEKPDLVFMDINLPLGPMPTGAQRSFFGFLARSSPEEGGVEAARYMLNRTPALKLIVCTGNPPEDPRVRDLVRSGAFDVIQKPVRASRVQEVIERLLNEE